MTAEPRTADVDVATPQSAADAVVSVLEQGGVRVAFGIPGTQIIELYEALARKGAIRHVLTRHEQGAGFAADGYARVAGSPGVCITTTGPGATNALTPLVEAYASSIPVLLLAGQIRSELIGRWKGNLHEITDQAAVFRPVTGYTATPRDAPSLALDVAGALRAMATGTPRPAYVELPTDLLESPVTGSPRFEPAPPNAPADERDVERAAAVLRAARRPLVIAGGGAVSARMAPQLAALAQRLGAPILTTVMGNGAAGDHPLCAGTVNPFVADGPTTHLVRAADATLVIGSRLDNDTTDRWRLPLANIVQIDLDPANIGRNYPVAVGLAGEARATVTALTEALGGRPTEEDAGWGAHVAAWARAEAIRRIPRAVAASAGFMQALRAAVPRETILASDSAMLNVWTAWHWQAYEPGTNVFAVRSSALGYALPAAIGAAVAAPDRPVLVAVGDGGFQFTLAELATAVQEGLNVTILLVNDDRYGSIAMDQEARYGRAVAADLRNPDFLALARAYGVPAQRAELTDAPRAIAAALREPGPALIEVRHTMGSPW